MRSPQDMRIIQIDITNACVHKCSNCTRFCGHHKKPFFMDWETFCRAVASLKGFNRTIGIMGGEPTLHPQFERFANHIAKEYPSKNKITTAKEPIKEFVQYIRDKNFFLDETLNERRGPGLWTSVCSNYYEHYELIQDVFSYQCINDHQNPSLHQPLLISRKEFGITDEEWLPLRDKCWIQNMWSATITPKGAFFCEVAGALDMLFDGPGGWPIEPGWWKRKPDEFGYQLQWCEMCGGALLNSGRLSSDEIDDVSPLIHEKLKLLHSPKLQQGRVNVLSPSQKGLGDEMPETRNRYLPDYQARISKSNTAFNPKTIDGIVFYNINTDVDALFQKVSQFTNSFDSLILAATDEASFKRTEARKLEAENVYMLASVLNEWGRTLNRAIYDASSQDWLCIVRTDADIPMDFHLKLRKVVLNPGVLYRFVFNGIKDSAILFNVRAAALKNSGYDGVSRCNSVSDFASLWNEDKQLVITDNLVASNNPDLEEWYHLVDSIDCDNKVEIYKCLDKIKSGS